MANETIRAAGGLVGAVASALAAVVALILLGGCSPKPAAEDEATAMKGGLEALYTRHDPNGAAVEFRKVLASNPSHYGATFQLAHALDSAGRAAEARPVWEKMLAMAESHGDTETAEVALAHLGGSPSTSEEATMRVGLDALYKRGSPAEAVAAFRTVLGHNPHHYGATFQLAAALDADGRRAEARPLWEKMLQMAEAAHDEETADTARTRLRQQP
jgi:Tfp pilus assembly protein PilF